MKTKEEKERELNEMLNDPEFQALSKEDQSMVLNTFGFTDDGQWNPKMFSKKEIDHWEDRMTPEEIEDMERRLEECDKLIESQRNSSQDTNFTEREIEEILEEHYRNLPELKKLGLV